jgi:periplasmic divalent cation tolerance protein
MNPEHACCVALSTFSNAESARAVARMLVESGLVACANVVPCVHSLYLWKGNVEENDEVLVIFKMTSTRWDEFVEKLRELHPYELPEIIRLNISGGLPDYLRWITENCARVIPSEVEGSRRET